MTGDRIHMNRLFVIKITGDRQQHNGSDSSVEKCKQTGWNLFFGGRLLLQTTEVDVSKIAYLCYFVSFVSFKTAAKRGNFAYLTLSILDVF